MKGFCPLSLCNVPIEVVSNMIVNRLKRLLPTIVSLNQISFIPGRHITDVITCQELLYSLRYTKATCGGMILKLDLEKAYDRMEWAFIEETWRDVSLPIGLITAIMSILRSSSCRLIWNNECTDSIMQTRGLRQGDPLSPYLFILCMDRLSQWIHLKVAQDEWKPLQASRGGPRVSHLMFADDVLLFSKATTDQVDCICEALTKF